MSAFQTLISRLHEATDSDGLGDAMSGFAKAHRLSRFSYGFAGQGLREPALVTTYPAAWAQRYLARRYSIHDSSGRAGKNAADIDGARPEPQALVRASAVRKLEAPTLSQARRNGSAQWSNRNVRPML
jgi:hypothetical protein